MSSLGEELRKAREERGITLRNISDATHIGMRFLQAIESDAYNQLPGGIFNRSFVRLFARQVGLDEEQVVARYDQQAAENVAEPQKPSASYLEDFDERSSSGRLWLPVLIFMILCAGAYAAYQYSSTNKSEDAPLAAQTVTPTPVATATPETSPTPAASPTPEATAVAEVRLHMTAKSANCWTRVVVDDGEPQERTLRSGESAEFVASGKLVLSVGNVRALNIEVNGQPARFETERGAGLKNVVITKENYQQFLQ